MNEKVTTTVMCDNEETIDNDEGQIRSSDYPNMIPDGKNYCQIRFYFEKLSIMELFLIDLPTLEVTYQDSYDFSSSRNNASRHMFIPPAYQVNLNIELNKLPQRRIWMYYRVLPTNSNHSSDKTGMPWTNSCQNQVTTPEPMNMTTLKSNPGISEMSKMTMFKVSSSPNPSKDMPSMHKTGANQGEKELSTAPHIVIPDGIPVDTEVVDKMEPVTIPVMPANTGSISSSTSSSSGGDVRPVEKPPNHPTHHENRKKASSVSETPTTGLYSREVVIGLIAGVVILACLVIILLTALVASMRRNPPNTIPCGTTKPPPPRNAAQLRRRSLADAEERDEHNSGPGITTNENLVSFQYLKTLPAEGDNGTLGTRSQESEDSISRDSTSKKSLITKPVKKKNSLAPSENESSKTADTISSKDDSVFHCFKNTDDYSNFHSEGSKSVDSGLMNKNDNSFTGRNRLDADLSKYAENHDGKDDDVFRDVPHFYVNGDDYALVQKDSRRSPRSTLIGDKSSIYANSSPRPKSGSSGSVQDSDVLEWTKGFNLAV
ncbi:unnamed protein product [Acanthosepion pharaonis]|uniref:Uncharacterized protein n=1 Tax=Acanthosepion pharaonis TaxID=158019 RepID=A0A812DVD8_ACAPH|nr:unnamed protein product [Sepia pharaonis]